MSQIENSKRASFQAVHFRDLEIRISNLFRISKFELRISKGKLDHFVNVVTKKTCAGIRASGKSQSSQEQGAARNPRGCRDGPPGRLYGMSPSSEINPRKAGIHRLAVRRRRKNLRGFSLGRLPRGVSIGLSLALEEYP